MTCPVVSVIIPSRNEKYLERTIRNVLENARGEVEVLAVLDGWLPEQRIEIGRRSCDLFSLPGIDRTAAGDNFAARKARGKVRHETRRALRRGRRL